MNREQRRRVNRGRDAQSLPRDYSPTHTIERIAGGQVIKVAPKQERADGIPGAYFVPQHFHIQYHIKDGPVVPDYSLRFESALRVREHMYEVGKQCEPGTFWEEEYGVVGIWAPLPGRTGKWWVVMEPFECTVPNCRPERQASGLILPTVTREIRQ